jgi:hypothetical protein
MKKIYKLLSNAKQGLFALVLTVFSGAAYAQTSYTFNYTGSSQTIALQAGSYSIQCWGANGGSTNGGRGGYSTGSITISSPTTYYIYVGGVGTTTNSTGSGNAPGGWNGGGNGSCYSGYGTSGGGGGGSDVRTTQNTNYANRIIVAGGGGGGGYYNTTGHAGGNGGGTTGGNGVGYLNGFYWTGQGGTQTAGGNGTTESNSIVGAGALGVGGSHSSTAPGSGWAGCGGGGGYYGGSAGGAVHSSGGGGSGYIGGVSNGTTVAFGQTGFVTNPVVSGNGRVLITELCDISLLINGVSGNTTICSGNSLSLTTSAVSNYSWSTGATTSSIVVTPTSTTVYSLTAMSASNCIASAQVTITVNNGVPTLTVVNTASATSGICPGKTVALTASGATTYTWTGGTSVTNSIPFAPTSTSGYTVTGENACGTSTAATSVSIHPLPTVGAALSQPTVCSGQSVTLTGTGNATLYTWTGGASNAQAHYPTVSGSYTVTGYSSLSCTNTAVTSLTVVQTPILAPVLSTVSICNGETATITASGATNYSWSTGSTASSIVVTPTTPTTYTLTKWNANCYDTKTVTLNVNQLPVVYAIASSGTVCASRPATLTASGGTVFNWLPAGGTQYTAAVSPSATTIYTVAVSDGKCANSTTVEVYTNPNPTINIATTATALCAGESATLTLSGALNYTWAQAGISGTNVVVTPSASVLYNVTGINSYSCTSQQTQIMVVNPLPALSTVMTRTLVCPGFPSTLTAGGGHVYSWQPNGANTHTTIVYPVNTTAYTVTGTFTTTGCSNTRTLQVAVFHPTFVSTPDTALCMGGSIVLSASGANSYSWAGFPANQQNVMVSPTVATIYMVTANVTSPDFYVSCLATQSVEVTIYNNPTITAVVSPTLICRYDHANLIASGGNTYLWSNSMSGGTVAVNPITQTNYVVTGTDVYGCKNTATVTVRVSTCPGISENNAAAGFALYPNPNKGSFTIKSERAVELSLVNELGQLIATYSLDGLNNYSAEVKGLAGGIYFISGGSGENRIHQKIVVSK